MCGRFILTSDMGTLKAVFHLTTDIFDHIPRYNIAPGQNVPVITSSFGRRDISLMRWGLIPHWAKEAKTGYKMINARAETIDRRPVFREAFNHRRCLIPADGFYEWQKANNKKLPLLVILPNESIFAFPGIWDHWTSPAGDSIYSFTIITTDANKYLQGVHNRMPVILAEEQEYRVWLEDDQPGALKDLLRPYPGEMIAYYVSPVVNSPKSDTPQCIEKVAEYIPNPN